MKMTRLFSLAVLLAFASLAQAHTHLTAAVPADKSVLAAPPAQIVLEFSGATRLTALSIAKEGAAALQIDSLPKERSASHTVPVAALAPGKYVVNWRVVGGDNHVMSGALSFTVAGK